ncbi:MAG: hypothetical protein Q7R33_00920 [Nitrosarchaeum sp.]|nr:hypothetical protein [Nitrosarchaeum sp.]
MDVKTAERKLATCMKLEMDFHNEHMQAANYEAMSNSGSVIELSKTLRDQYDQLRRNTERCGEELATYPELFDVMECWMVDVKGSCRTQINDINQVFSSDNLVDEIKSLVDQTGNLTHSITQFVEQHGFVITDRGCGCDSWHIGVPCNDSNARRLCSLLHLTYSKAIELNLIKVVKHFWGFKLPGLKNWNDLEKWLENNSL